MRRRRSRGGGRRGRVRRGERQCVGRREAWCGAGREERVEADRGRVDAGGGFARVSVLVVDLDELNIGELFEVDGQRAGNGVECAVGLTGAGQVDVRHTVGELEPAVACEAVEDEGKPVVAFHVAGTLEELVQDSTDQVLHRGDKARHCHLVGKFAADEPFVIREVDVHLYEQRRARGGGRPSGGRCDTRREGGRDR